MVESSERYVYGINPVIELLRANPDRIDKLFAVRGGLNPRIAGELLSRARDANVRVEFIEKERMARLGKGAVHQGVVAEVQHFDYLELEQLMALAEKSDRPALYVLLDGVTDPHNFGAIVRSAYAFGATGLIIPKDRSVSVTGVVAKASAGAIEHSAIARVTNLSRSIELLKKAGVWVVAAEPGGDRTLWAAPLDGPIAIVVGAEGAGVRDGVLGHCDFHVKIPMVGQVASLNASVSASVLLAEVARQRAAKG